MWHASANFDERQFPDAMMLALTAPRCPPLWHSGGGGAHFCLGISLARLELAILIEEILRRNVTLDIVKSQFVQSNFVTGIEHMPVTITS